MKYHFEHSVGKCSSLFQSNCPNAVFKRKTIVLPQDYVSDNDTAKFRVHKFYQLGEIELDEALSTSRTDHVDPVKLTVNGSVVTNVKLNEEASGSFTMKVKANDTAGEDTVTLTVDFRT